MTLWLRYILSGSDDSQAESEVVREEASGSVQEVSHAETQSRFPEIITIYGNCFRQFDYVNRRLVRLIEV